LWLRWRRRQGHPPAGGRTGAAGRAADRPVADLDGLLRQVRRDRSAGRPGRVAAVLAFVGHLQVARPGPHTAKRAVPVVGQRRDCDAARVRGCRRAQLSAHARPGGPLPARDEHDLVLDADVVVVAWSREACCRRDEQGGLRGRAAGGQRRGSRVDLVVVGVIDGQRRRRAALQHAVEDRRRRGGGEATTGRIDAQERPHAAEALVEVGEFVQCVAVPREVPLAADVLGRRAGRQRSLVAEVRAAAVPGVAVLECHVAVVRRRDRQRVGAWVPVVLVIPAQQEVLGLPGADRLAEVLGRRRRPTGAE